MAEKQLFPQHLGICDSHQIGRLPSWMLTRMQKMQALTVVLCALAFPVVIAASSTVLLSTHLAICPGQRFSVCYPAGKEVRFGMDWSQEDPIVYSVFSSDFPYGGYFVFMEALQGHVVTEANRSFGIE